MLRVQALIGLLVLVWLTLAMPGVVWAVGPGGTEGATVLQSAESIPFRQDDVLSPSGLIQLVSALLISLLLLGLIAVLLRRFGFAYRPGQQSDRRIQVLEVKRLSAKSVLFLVQADERVLLIGQIGDRLVRLDSDMERTLYTMEAGQG